MSHRTIDRRKQRPGALLGISALVLVAAACDKSSDPADSDPRPGAPKAAAPVDPTPEPEAAPAPVALREGEHARLAALVGSWRGTGTLTMGDQTAAVSSSFDCEVAPGGVAVTCVHQADIEGMGAMTENALFGFDPVAKAYHWYNVNTMGETHDHLGHWASDDRLEWTFEGQSEGQPLVESITMDLAGDTLRFRSTTTVGGEPKTVFEGTLKPEGV
jgi:hypothetical protein